MVAPVFDFPGTSQPQGNSRPILVQPKLTREFVNAIDTWRRSRSAPLPRTQAIVELAALGLAGEMIERSKTRRKCR
jgi:hypothetical protein